MDEAQIALDTAVEVAKLTRELNNIQMLFYITILVIAFSALMFILFYRFSNANARGDGQMQKDLLSALADSTKASSHAVKVFSDERKIYWARNRNERQQFWERNSREHRQIAKHMSKMTSILQSIVVTLNVMKDEMEKRSHENETNLSPLPNPSPVLNPNYERGSSRRSTSPRRSGNRSR